MSGIEGAYGAKRKRGRGVNATDPALGVAAHIGGCDISPPRYRKPATAISAEQTGNWTMRPSNDASVAAAVARPLWNAASRDEPNAISRALPEAW
jgi:hypothetical protein